ncbi:MAG TPA: ribosome maturation factor RimM [Gemmatimonadota bacterium]|nr:ribosome maturation factor RimM [Gemmatimonadota bacterium]
MAGPEHLAVGRIVKPHGIRGEVAVFPLTENEERFEPGSRLLLSRTAAGDGTLLAVTVESSRPHQGRWLLTLDRIEDRTHAEQHVGSYLLVPREEAEAARAEGEWFLHSLIGRRVVDDAGSSLGAVLDVLETPGAVMLEIGAAGRSRRLLPFVREFVARVGEEEIVVTPPQGWLEL